MNSEIKTCTNEGQVSSMSPSVIDVDELARWPRDAVKQWYASVDKEIDLILQKRFAYYLARPVELEVAEHRKSYSPDEIAAVVAKFASGSIHNRVLHCTTYLSIRYNVSCHELLFGTKRQIELFGRTKAFISLITAVQDSLYLCKIRECLEKGFLNTNSPMYVLKERCLEVGCAQGMNFTDTCAMVFGSPSQQEILNTIYAPGFSHREENHPRNVVLHLPGHAMVLRDCRKFGVSADYLILQDYSDFAIFNGQTLTDVQKEWLSLYLCASSDAQTIAISMLTKYQVKMFCEKVDRSSASND